MDELRQAAKDAAIKELRAHPELIIGTPPDRAEAIVAALERAYLQGFADAEGRHDPEGRHGWSDG
jgi:hypothetical protein